MKRTSLNLFGIAGILACTPVVYAQRPAIGEAAPQFGVMGMGGRQIYLKDMMNEGSPTFLFFINDRDSTCSEASSYINQIVKSYSPARAKWFGIINSVEDRTRSYQAEFNPPYALYMDTRLISMRAFGVLNSPAVIEIDRNGKITNEWRGFSGSMLKKLNRAVAAANGKRAVSLDFSKTPSTTMYGNQFTSPNLNGG